jgi:hypothetical protein
VRWLRKDAHWLANAVWYACLRHRFFTKHSQIISHLDEICPL